MFMIIWLGLSFNLNGWWNALPPPSLSSEELSELKESIPEASLRDRCLQKSEMVEKYVVQ